MDLETLKAIQTPLKENYRNNPELAVVQLHAKGEVSVRDQQCTVETYSGSTRAGLHPAAGGSSADACSAEMLLESLIACAGVTLGAVATNMSLKIDSCTIEATGTMDFR
ncbi:MAG: OsmC family protein, partial [Planctomycetes bacterium]|nr:OsmC family protein [Planctomycetota bacterium]